MSPRNYQFQYQYPDIAKEYHEELSSFIPNVYNGIKNALFFFPRIFINKSQGTEDSTNTQ